MRYKPKFCCECREPIERDKRTLFSSRRFCQLCETDYQLEDWIPRAVVAAGILFGIFGLGTFLQKPEKPLNVVAGNSTNANKSQVNSQVSLDANAKSFAKTQNANFAVEQPASKLPTAAPKQELKAQKVENQPTASPETIYFCGAETKKGTPCTRRVRGGGRCWQHAGRAAILSPQKLVASR